MLENKKKGIMRGAIAKQTGLNAETIRYYEKIGLLKEPGRSEGGRRIYSPEDAQTLNFIRRSRELGFSLEDIRGLLALVDKQEISCERIQLIADDHILSIQQKINDLQRMKLTLSELSDRCSGEDVPDCPIIEVLQR